jgi:hypothetical protein
MDAPRATALPLSSRVYQSVVATENLLLLVVESAAYFVMLFSSGHLIATALGFT